MLSKYLNVNRREIWKKMPTCRVRIDKAEKVLAYLS